MRSEFSMSQVQVKPQSKILFTGLPTWASKWETMKSRSLWQDLIKTMTVDYATLSFARLSSRKIPSMRVSWLRRPLFQFTQINYKTRNKFSIPKQQSCSFRPGPLISKTRSKPSNSESWLKRRMHSQLTRHSGWSMPTMIASSIKTM